MRNKLATMFKERYDRQELDLPAPSWEFVLAVHDNFDTDLECMEHFCV